MISTSLLRNQRHCTNPLCWNMQNFIKWLAKLFWDIRGTELTIYFRMYKSLIYFFFFDIRGTRLTRYVGTWKLCLDQYNPFEMSEALDLHAILEYAKFVWVISTYFETSVALGLHSILEIAKVQSNYQFWVIRSIGLTIYVRIWKFLIRTFLLKN